VIIEESNMIRCERYARTEVRKLSSLVSFVTDKRELCGRFSHLSLTNKYINEWSDMMKFEFCVAQVADVSTS